MGLNGGAAPGFSSGQALSLMEQAAAAQLPANIGYSWTGMSLQEKIVGNQAIYIFALSILLVYLVLAALYESWTNPMAVILAVPLALLGVVGGMMARQFDNDMYCQIGIVLMIAMAAKNAILVVEFARGERAKGVPLAEAAINAARERFRPIMMTSLAFILGMAPLATAAGRGRRRPAGPGHGGARRHDLGHPVQQPVRAAVLRHAAGLQRMALAATTWPRHTRGARSGRRDGLTVEPVGADPARHLRPCRQGHRQAARLVLRRAGLDQIVGARRRS